MNKGLKSSCLLALLWCGVSCSNEQVVYQTDKPQFVPVTTVSIDSSNLTIDSPFGIRPEDLLGKDYDFYLADGAPNLAILKGYSAITTGVLDYENKDSHYGMTHIVKGDSHIVWLDSTIDGKRINEHHFMILDVVIIKAPKGMEVTTSDPCGIDTTLKEGLFALTTYNKKRRTYKVHKAWQLDWRKRKIVPIRNLSKVYCEVSFEGCDGEDD